MNNFAVYMNVRFIIFLISLACTLTLPIFSYGCDENEPENFTDHKAMQHEETSSQNSCCDIESESKENHDCGKDCKNHACECSISASMPLVNNIENEFLSPYKYFTKSFFIKESKIFLNGSHIAIWNPPKPVF